MILLNVRKKIMTEWHKIKDIEKDPDQWWPEAQEVLVRGSYEQAEKEAIDRKYKSYTIEKWEWEKTNEG